MASDIFISYARADRATVEALARCLEEAGHSLWWDHQIAGGAAFAAEIERALNDARAVVVAWSVHGVQSEWVHDEAGVAKQAGKLVPICLDATPPPLGFRQIQAIDFSQWDGTREAPEFGALTNAVRRFAPRDHRGDALAGRDPLPAATEAVAVLPFENLSGDEGQQFFVDGIHGAVITELSKVGALKVISRTSTRRYAGTDKSSREIAAELGVAKLVDGSVARHEDEVSVTVQLIDARSDSNLWAESFDRSMSSVLKLQREVARSIAEEIRVVLTPQERARLSAAPRVDPAAYDAYLRGMYHWYRITPHDLEEALRCFETALASDPGYAPAHAGIAAVWAGVQQMGAAPPRVAGPKIEQAVNRALAADNTLAQAHFTDAVFQTWTSWDWTRAEAAFRRAIDLNPNFPDAHAYFAHFLNIVGRFDEAEPHALRSMDLDPFNPLMRGLFAVDLFFWGRLEEATQELNSVLNSAPDHWLAFQVLRLVHHAQGRSEEALAASRSLYATLGNGAVVEALDRGETEGGYHAAMSRAAEALALQARTAYVAPIQVALLFDMAGDVDSAANWIAKACEVGDPEVPYLKNLPRFSGRVLAHPDVVRVMDRLGYPISPRNSDS